MVTRLFSCKQMKKIFFSLVMLLISMTAKSEIWYYILSGHSPEESNITVDIVIKDNSGQLWRTFEDIQTFKQHLLNNRDYYIDAFNKGTHTGGGDPFFGVPSYTDENQIFSPMIQYAFSRLIFLKKTEKSYVLKDSKIGTQYAFSFDFETMIQDCNRVNPVYHTSVPVDRFIVRRSIDDLF